MNLETFFKATQILCDLNVLELDVVRASAGRSGFETAAPALHDIIDRLDTLSVAKLSREETDAAIESLCDDLYGLCGLFEYESAMDLASRTQAAADALEGLAVAA